MWIRVDSMCGTCMLLHKQGPCACHDATQSWQLGPFTQGPTTSSAATNTTSTLSFLSTNTTAFPRSPPPNYIFAVLHPDFSVQPQPWLSGGKCKEERDAGKYMRLTECLQVSSEAQNFSAANAERYYRGTKAPFQLIARYPFLQFGRHVPAQHVWSTIALPTRISLRGTCLQELQRGTETMAKTHVAAEETHTKHPQVLFATGDAMAQQGVEGRGLENHDLARTGRMAAYGGGTSPSSSSLPPSQYD
jgi:hypothetical protein